MTCKDCVHVDVCLARYGKQVERWASQSGCNRYKSKADFVEVVRCKECKYLMFSDMYGECGRGYMGIVSPNNFCSRGERKDGAE